MHNFLKFSFYLYRGSVPGLKTGGLPDGQSGGKGCFAFLFCLRRFWK